MAKSSTTFQNGRAKTGGRRKGTPNRKTVEVQEKLTALDCDPIEAMARIAMDQENPIELRAQMFRELAQYVAPKRKAIEHTGAGGGPMQVNIIRFSDGDDNAAE